jgi:hypothetical protein
MACIIGEGSTNFFFAQRCNVNDYLTTAEMLDILPYSVEEAAQEFGESLRNLSFSIVEAVHNAFYDSFNDFSLAAQARLQENEQDKQPNRCSTQMLLDESLTSLGKIQLSLTNADVINPAPPTTKPQTKLYTDEVTVHEYESWPTSSQTFHPLVEVSPGFIVRLRGYEETQEACRVPGKTKTTKCSSCKAALLCVEDAEFVLCQTCRFISPVQQSKRDFCSPDDSSDFKLGGGLALGLVSSPLVLSLCLSLPTLRHKIKASSEGELQPSSKRAKYGS